MKFFSTTLFALCLSLIVATDLAAQDPWARVPAFPTACYSRGETFDSDVGKIAADLEDAIKKQTAINTAVKAKLGELDQATKQSRMMTFLQKDPMNAGKYMQEMSTGGQKENDMNQALGEKRNALLERRKKLDAQYTEDAKHLGAPTVAEYSDSKSTAADAKLIARHNASYLALCAKYWTSAANPYLSYLADLKRFLTEDAIPAGNEFARIEKLNFDVFGVPSAGYKSTAELEAVKEYVQAARSVFGGRPVQPRN